MCVCVSMQARIGMYIYIYIYRRVVCSPDAAMSAVRPSERARLQSAPRERRALTMGREPFSAPVMRGVEPSRDTALVSALDCKGKEGHG